MKIPLLVNPGAGKGLGREMGPAIARYLRELGLPPQVHNSNGPGHVQALMGQVLAEKPRLVVVAGGDGTVHEAVNGWLKAGGGAPLAVVPVGSGNDFVKMLDASHDWRESCWRAARGETRRVDVGRCNDYYFANGLGIGFDAQVAVEANGIRWVGGNAVYGVALAKTLLLRHATPTVCVQHDGESFETDITLLTVNNGRVEGGSFIMAPDAEIDDGLFDVVVAAGMGRFGILGLVPQVLKGEHLDHPKVTTFRTAKLTVESDRGLPIHADGELTYSGATKLEIELLPKRLEVII
ncbi:MAG TPA: diacylglycerol kinase family protein [Gammaproteobacteria bacterium]|nr:diacylglycerol kinase family protein [Gammaproteobacteria bacterium]